MLHLHKGSARILIRLSCENLHIHEMAGQLGSINDGKFPQLFSGPGKHKCGCCTFFFQVVSTAMSKNSNLQNVMQGIHCYIKLLKVMYDHG